MRLVQDVFSCGCILARCLCFLSAVHTYQSGVRKDLECHNNQASSEKCIDMLHLSGVFSLQKILRVASDLSEAGRYRSHFRDRKPKAWEEI